MVENLLNKPKFRLFYVDLLVMFREKNWPGFILKYGKIIFLVTFLVAFSSGFRLGVIYKDTGGEISRSQVELENNIEQLTDLKIHHSDEYVKKQKENDASLQELTKDKHALAEIKKTGAGVLNFICVLLWVAAFFRGFNFNVKMFKRVNDESVNWPFIQSLPWNKQDVLHHFRLSFWGRSVLLNILIGGAFLLGMLLAGLTAPFVFFLLLNIFGYMGFSAGGMLLAVCVKITPNSKTIFEFVRLIIVGLLAVSFKFLSLFIGNSAIKMDLIWQSKWWFALSMFLWAYLLGRFWLRSLSLVYENVMVLFLDRPLVNKSNKISHVRFKKNSSIILWAWLKQVFREKLIVFSFLSQISLMVGVALHQPWSKFISEHGKNAEMGHGFSSVLLAGATEFVLISVWQSLMMQPMSFLTTVPMPWLELRNILKSVARVLVAMSLALNLLFGAFVMGLPVLAVVLSWFAVEKLMDELFVARLMLAPRLKNAPLPWRVKIKMMIYFFVWSIFILAVAKLLEALQDLDWSFWSKVTHASLIV